MAAAAAVAAPYLAPLPIMRAIGTRAALAAAKQAVTAGLGFNICGISHVMCHVIMVDSHVVDVTRM